MTEPRSVFLKNRAVFANRVLKLSNGHETVRMHSPDGVMDLSPESAESLAEMLIEEAKMARSAGRVELTSVPLLGSGSTMDESVRVLVNLAQPPKRLTTQNRTFVALMDPDDSEKFLGAYVPEDAPESMEVPR